ncbi:MAG: sodium:solute symporter [Prevotellaceae bacterium]|jgi:Na+/proline symporter|nr:sodium:solute symporter [Prevotellaceae bacterium]
MNPYIVIGIIAAYFAIILVVSRLTSRNSQAGDFYRGNKKTPWWVVAFGMIGTTLSGVTFISVPGWVASSAKMTYFEVILGNFLGYILIMQVLLPLYYRLNLTSIYTFIEQRFGFKAYKTGAVLFLGSKIIGAGFRLFIIALVLQMAVFEPLGLPFALNAILSVFLIWAYTFRGGVKTIIWTDVIQTAALIFAVIFTIGAIQQELGWSFSKMTAEITHHPQFQLFDFSHFWTNGNNFFKQFVSGALITIVMTGIDQDMMQKNLGLKTLRTAKKNFFSFSLALVPVNFIFLCLGVLFVIFMQQKGIPLPSKTDAIYPQLALQYLPQAVGICFIVGVIAAAFSSANSAMIAMTTSFMVDIYGIKNRSEATLRRTRQLVHGANAAVLAAVLVMFEAFNNDSVVQAVFKFAGYTYGPLLGLFAVGIMTKLRIRDAAVPWIAIFSIVATVLTDKYSTVILGGYRFGFEILLFNGLITVLGLWLFSLRRHK